MSNNVLTPVSILDKNGVVTTRNKNLNKNTVSESRLGGLPAIGAIQGTGLSEPKVTVPEPYKQSKIREGEERLEHQSFEFEEQVWDLAPEGYSGAYCNKCQSFFTDEEIMGISDGTITCSSCGEVCGAGGPLLCGVRDDARKFFSKDAVRQETWFHITLNSNWFNDITLQDDMNYQPFVHIGTQAAALNRMKALIEEGANIAGNEPLQFYCYEVKVKPSAAIGDSVLPDDNDLAPAMPIETHYNYTTDGYEEFGVTRYVNEYESHGSISLLTHPSAFEIIRSYPVVEDSQL